jgi:hypothetical protein
MRELTNDELLEVGAIIHRKNAFFEEDMPVIKVTKTMASTKYMRFTIRYGFGFHSIPYERFDDNKYKVYTNRELNTNKEDSHDL